MSDRDKVDRYGVRPVFKYDFNNDGRIDKLEAGPTSIPLFSTETGEKIGHADGYATDPFILAKDGTCIPFERAPKELVIKGRKGSPGEFGTYIFTDRTSNTRFYDADGIRSFVPGQHVAVVNRADSVTRTMVLSGLVLGIKMDCDSEFRPVQDEGGHTLLRGAFTDEKGKLMQEDLENLVWTTSAGDRIDPRLLVGEKDEATPLTYSETMLAPLFERVRNYSEKYGVAKTDHEKWIAREFLTRTISDWRSVSREIDPTRSDAIYLDKPLWEGIEMALGYVMGLKPFEISE